MLNLRYRGTCARILVSLLLATSLVSCSDGSSKQTPPPPPTTFSIGGTTSGLAGSLVLQNNGGDDLTINADGAFTFATTLDNNAAYAVAVLTQPTDQECVVNEGSGTTSGADVTIVDVQCRPESPSLSVSGREVRLLRFAWSDVTGETEYRLLEDLTGVSGFTLRDVISADSESADIEVFIPDFVNARYMVQACNAAGCYDSNVVMAVDALNDAIGYGKAAVADADDSFGGYRSTSGFLSNIALSADGNTLAVGVPGDDSSATGIDGDSADNSSADSGAVYIFSRVGPGVWSVPVFIKASNAEPGDAFGAGVSLSDDGNRLAVSALNEDSSATGVGGSESDNSAIESGAAYIFDRDSLGIWSQQAYVKASNSEAGDIFGLSLDLSGNGQVLIVGAPEEGSSAAGIDGDQANNLAAAGGAAYVFSVDGAGMWSQESYVKPSNTAANDRFGWSVAIDVDGDMFAVGAKDEDSAAAGIGADQSDNMASSSGAVYVFQGDGGSTWGQQAYVKASNPGESDIFGFALSVSNDGLTLVVGAPNEASASSGINGSQSDDSMDFAGAAYVFVDDGLGNWGQQAYVKASNTARSAIFGSGVILSADGSKLLVSAYFESSDSVGINGDQFNSLAFDSGAAYLLNRDGTGVWSQQTYLKSPNSEAGDRFGAGLAIAGDGNMIVIGAPGEDSASGFGGDQADNSAVDAGAVYIF